MVPRRCKLISPASRKIRRWWETAGLDKWVRPVISGTRIPTDSCSSKAIKICCRVSSPNARKVLCAFLNSSANDCRSVLHGSMARPSFNRLSVSTIIAYSPPSGASGKKIETIAEIRPCQSLKSPCRPPLFPANPTGATVERGFWQNSLTFPPGAWYNQNRGSCPRYRNNLKRMGYYE